MARCSSGGVVGGSDEDGGRVAGKVNLEFQNSEMGRIFDDFTLDLYTVPTG
jgi:hypothetical protein